MPYCPANIGADEVPFNPIAASILQHYSGTSELIYCQTSNGTTPAGNLQAMEGVIRLGRQRRLSSIGTVDLDH